MRRAAVIARYLRELPAILPGVEVQRGLGEPGHMAHLFVVKLPLGALDITRDEFLLAMRERNIGAAIHYATLHEMPLYNREVPQGPLPKVESIAAQLLTLPISGSMTDGDAEDVLAAIADIAASHLKQPRAQSAMVQA